MWAAEALGEIGKEVRDDRIIDALIEGVLWLTSKDKKKQNSLMPGDAAKALGKIGDTRAIEPLIEAFKHAEDFGDRRCIALFGLSKFKDERVIRVLEEALFEPRNEIIKGNLLLALGDIGDKKSVDILIAVLEEAIEDKNEEVEEVIYGSSFALCKIGDKSAIPYVEKALKKGKWKNYQKVWVVEEFKTLIGRDYRH